MYISINTLLPRINSEIPPLKMLKRRLLMIFIDGLGVGVSDPLSNPLAEHPDLWPTRRGSPSWPGLRWKPIDACLGVAGLPQSATGQTALLTGINAPKMIGKHVQGFPSKKLVAMLHEHSIFLRLQRCGLSGTFANAYRHPEDLKPSSRLSVTSHAVRASGQPFRSLEDLRQGKALTHDFTNRLLIDRGYEVPIFAPERAAEILVNLAQEHDFTLYEHFLTDVLAHRGSAEEIRRHVALLSQFMRAILSRIEGQALSLIITSDHGNLEDGTTRTHTRNPVPLMWLRQNPLQTEPWAEDITDVTPWILELLNCSNPD